MNSFEWIEHLISDILGSAAGTAIINKIGEGGGEIIKERIKKLTENHREIFFKTFYALEEEYREKLQERLNEAIRFNLEDWLVNHIGWLLEDIDDDNVKKTYLVLFARLPHINGLSEKELRQEWKRPQKSKFLTAVYLLEDDKGFQFIRRTIDTAIETIANLKQKITDNWPETKEKLQKADHVTAQKLWSLNNWLEKKGVR